jgi:hypothetical protein
MSYDINEKMIAHFRCAILTRQGSHVNPRQPPCMSEQPTAASLAEKTAHTLG